MTKPVLSVVIPTRDRRIFLRKAVEYFERMNPVVNAELIIVDSGRTPLSSDDVKGHVYIRGVLGGPVGVQMNLGIMKAQGEFFLKQDDDDWYSPDWYDSSLETVTTAPSGIAGVIDFYAYDLLKNAACKWSCWGQPPSQGHWCGSTMSFRRSIWEKVKFGDVRIGSDHEFVTSAYALDPTPRSIVPGGTNKHVVIRHGGNLTGPGFLGTATPEDLAEVKAILGDDLEFYESLAEVLGRNDHALALAALQKKLAVRGKYPIGHPGWWA